MSWIDAHAEIGENVDPARRRSPTIAAFWKPKMTPILPSRFARRMSAARQHLDEVGRMVAEARLPQGDLAHRLLERLAVAGDIADRLS